METYQFVCHCCGTTHEKTRDAAQRNRQAIAHGKRCRKAGPGYEIRDEKGRVIFRKR